MTFVRVPMTLSPKPFLLQGSCGSLPVSEVVQVTSCESDEFVNDPVLNLFKHQYLGLLP